VKPGLLGMFLLTLATAAAAPQTQLDELITRTKSFELDTPYVPRAEPSIPPTMDGIRPVYVAVMGLTGVGSPRGTAPPRGAMETRCIFIAFILQLSR
jgi:hypothetical protein